jgi:hypothetical protein
VAATQQLLVTGASMMHRRNKGGLGGKVIFKELMRWLTSWHRRRVLAGARLRLEALRQSALSAYDDISRDYLIVSVNMLLADLQARSIITLAERRGLAREWTRDYVRVCLPAFYRDRNAEAIERLGWFLKAG